MMKKLLLLVFLLSGCVCFTQKKLTTKTGVVVFEASVPTFQEVTAKNESASCTFYPDRAEIASLVLIKGFRFKVPLMEVHFNENYMESNSYPKAIFKGVIQNFNYSKLTSTPKTYIVKGKIKVKGKTKNIDFTANIKKNGQGMEIISDFILDVGDFDITIPTVVSKKIARKVNVSIDYALN